MSITDLVHRHCLDDDRRRLAGFGGGKDSTMVAFWLNKTGRDISESRTLTGLRDALLPKSRVGELRMLAAKQLVAK
ncbi:MAG: hypothetical protein FJ388_01835 [Verrucomicrobia bacterium]|nr:hypothetical protein [Verrucomicrobiota bacterium]